MRGLMCVVLVTAFMAANAADGPAPAVSADAPNVLGSVGIGVQDLQRSIAFYGDVLGMKVLRRFDLGYLNEVVLGFPEGSGANVVLMNWPQEGARQYDGNNVKLVFYVHDPAAVIARIRAHGGRIDREAAPLEALNGTVVGLGRDPDNYVVELLGR
jgi:catechol 2,3-dioxygenase-like lactoylglutathione lyase family enzyme